MPIIKYWDATANGGVGGWAYLSGATGPQGIQGLQGRQGLQGLQGVQGIQGVQGTDGVQGLQGTQGTQGVQGYVQVGPPTGGTDGQALVKDSLQASTLNWASVLSYPSGGSNLQALTKTGTSSSAWSSVVNSLKFSNSSLQSVGHVLNIQEAPALIRRTTDRTKSTAITHDECFGTGDIGGSGATSLGLDLEASSLYQFSGIIYLQRTTSSATTALSISFDTPTGSSLHMNSFSEYQTAGAVYSATYSETPTTAGSPTRTQMTAGQTATGIYTIEIRGFLQTPSSLGSTKFTPKYGTFDETTTGTLNQIRILTSSYLEVVKLGPSSLTDVINGSWT